MQSNIEAIRIETERKKKAQRRSSAKFRMVRNNVISLLVVLLVWQVLSIVFTSPFFPSPLGVWKAGVDLAVNGDLEGYSLWEHTYVSIYRVLAGFALSVVIGVPLGILMGLVPSLYSSTRSVLEPVRFIPPIAWIPMAIVLLSGFERYMFLIWLGAFFPIFINVLVAVPKVDTLWKDAVKVYGGRSKDIILKVIIPAVSPDILSGMRVGLGVGWMCIVAAEMIGGETVGIGRMIVKYSELLRIDEIIVGMFIIGIIGFVSNELLIRLEKKLFKWRA